MYEKEEPSDHQLEMLRIDLKKKSRKLPEYI